MRGPSAPKILLMLTAVGWWLGSVSGWLLLVHQGCLLLVLLTARTGRLTGWNWLVAALSVPIPLGMIEQPAVGAVFMLVGAWALLQRTPASYGVASASVLVGGALLGAWLVSRIETAAFDPYAALLVYEGALVAGAGALVLGSRAEETRSHGLIDRVIAGAGAAASVDLSIVLAEVLQTPGLRLIRVPVSADPRVDLPIHVGGRLVAVVRHPAVIALDAPVRDSVAAAVRLVLLAEDRRALLDAQTTALNEAQRRLVTAQDEQRALTAGKLRDDVVAPLRAASAALEGEIALGEPAMSAAAEVALTQIRAATADVESVVQGAGPLRLGHGRLVAAVRDIARGSPVAVQVRVEGTVAASEEVERALYYVCAEALVNVHRHAMANRATVVLIGSTDMVRIEISDDGIGGADPGRPGLSGLAERVTMLGGRLGVHSPRGAGTTLSAELPPRSATRPPATTSPA
jgi:signal transduction histidine kinase